MYFNYKKIDYDIKTSLKAFEEYVSFNKLNNYKELNESIFIIYNEKYKSKEIYKKTQMIEKLEFTIDKIVNFKLNKKETIKDVNIFLNKISSQIIEKIIVKSRVEELYTKLHSDFCFKENSYEQTKQQLLKELKNTKYCFIQESLDELKLIDENKNIFTLFGGDIKFDTYDFTRHLLDYIKFFSLADNDFNFFRSLITASKLVDKFIEVLYKNVSNELLKTKNNAKIESIKSFIRLIHQDIHHNEYMKIEMELWKEKGINKHILYNKYISNIPILDIFKDQDTYFYVEEFEKYVKRIEKYGEYKDFKAKEKAIFKIFNPSITPTKYEIAEYKYRDTITSDYSDRMNCILKVLRKTGNKGNPAFEKKDNYTVYKMGEALDDSDIELFYYLIGELEEHGCNNKITFRKSDFVNNMNYKSVRGQKLDKLTASIMALNTQSIAIIDERKDKTGKKLKNIEVGKKGTQLIRIDFEGKGDEMLIHIESPFSKYFRQQKQFGRILSKDMISNHLFKNPRILRIARELSRMIYINSQKNRGIKKLEINYDTLMKNIDQEERYKSYQNKRLFLNNLNKDIEQAIKYITDTKGKYKFDLNKPTPTTIKNGKIKILKSS